MTPAQILDCLNSLPSLSWRHGAARDKQALSPASVNEERHAVPGRQRHG